MLKLDIDGIIPPGQTIEDEEILVGKVLTPSDNSIFNNMDVKKRYKDASLRSRRAERATVDLVVVS